METISQAARRLGAAKIEGGINWTWAFFNTKVEAEAFIIWMDGQKIHEHRGIYSPRTDRPNVAEDKFWGVRFR